MSLLQMFRKGLVKDGFCVKCIKTVWEDVGQFGRDVQLLLFLEGRIYKVTQVILNRSLRIRGESKLHVFLVPTKGMTKKRAEIRRKNLRCFIPASPRERNRCV